MYRRSKYRKEFCGQVIQLMKDGHSIASVAKEIGVSVSTIYNWEKNPEYADFQDAMKYARDYRLAWWEELGRKLASGEVKGNVTAWIYSVKCLFKDKWNPDSAVIDSLLSPNSEQRVDEQLLTLLKGYLVNDKKSKSGSGQHTGTFTDVANRGETRTPSTSGTKETH